MSAGSHPINHITTQYINQMWAMIAGLLLVLLWPAASQLDIAVLDSNTFAVALESHQHLLVYFYDDGCAQCPRASEMFYTLSALCSREGLQVWPAMIDARGNQQLFQEQGVAAVPEFVLYIRESKSRLKYPYIQIHELTLQYMLGWMGRVIAPRIDDLDVSRASANTQKVIINCRDAGLKRCLLGSRGYLENLDTDYACQGDVAVGRIRLQDQQQTREITGCCDQKQISQACEAHIFNFRHRELLHWSDELINLLFNVKPVTAQSKHKVFVAMTSNQTQSHELVRNLTRIRQQMYETEAQKANPSVLPIFSVADMHHDLQGTMRLKKFLGGYTSKGRPYPFPLLAHLFVNDEGDLAKYIYWEKVAGSKKPEQTIDDWIPKALSNSLKVCLRTQGEQVNQNATESNSEHSINKLNLPELLRARQKYCSPTEKKTPCLMVYVSWRNDWAMQELFMKLRHQWGLWKLPSRLFRIDYYQAELPEQFSITHLPAFLAYFPNGQHQLHQGIQDIEELQEKIHKLFKAGQ